MVIPDVKHRCWFNQTRNAEEEMRKNIILNWNFRGRNLVMISCCRMVGTPETLLLWRTGFLNACVCSDPPLHISSTVDQLTQHSSGSLSTEGGFQLSKNETCRIGFLWSEWRGTGTCREWFIPPILMPILECNELPFRAVRPFPPVINGG